MPVATGVVYVYRHHVCPSVVSARSLSLYFVTV
jgi:hypothetical protein